MTLTIDDLRRVIRTCPVIDNHAHNLLLPDKLRESNFLTITTEASGEALEDAPKSLAHIRAARQLRTLYGLPSDADWNAILQRRDELLHEDADSLIRKCFDGIHTVLIDDGLGDANDFRPYQWHDKFTHSPCKRIVRIETVAATIMSTLYQQGKLPKGVAIADKDACSMAWVTFITAFEQAIAAALEEEDIVGFKSVVCYRTGLDIRLGSDVEVLEHGQRHFTRQYLPTCESKNFRIEHKAINDALVISTCKLIAAAYAQTGRAKPVQFHTGLGDNDISLLDANPACLQPLIKEFATVPIVLLHSAYPYTREAGYLATVYKNAYLDIGEVFPMVSRNGQESIVRQALELTPTSKLLWSTDGHLQAETYYLANIQGREAIEKVMCELVDAEDLTVDQAIDASKDIFFRNSNDLYGLELSLPETRGPSREVRNENANETNPAIGPPATQDMHQPPEPYEFYFVQWLDWMGTLRARCIPCKEFRRLSDTGQLRFGVSRGNLGTLQNDVATSVCSPVGQIFARPQMDSLRPMHQGKLPGKAATLIASYEEEDGSSVSLCPRSYLKETLRTISADHNITFLVGFEVEVTFCRTVMENGHLDSAPLDTNHAWSTFTAAQYARTFPLMLSITQALEEMGIHIMQVHSESGAGQYEFVLPPLPLLQAVDTLVQTRQTIAQIAALNELHASCHPLPFPGIGTACHANISFQMSEDQDAKERLQMSFMASVLAHLPGLCAFTMAEAVSYGRVADDKWTSGSWVAWGTHNREVPLRRVDTADGYSSRWEVRCLDGVNNMYLVLNAVLRTGLLGVREQTEMPLGDCLSNPSTLSASERMELGITAKLPTSLEKSLEALETDTTLTDAIGSHIVKHYLAMKNGEQEMLQEMPEHESRSWLMHRY